MTKTLLKAATMLVLSATATITFVGTANAMEFDPDAQLDPSQVEDLRGCTNPDPKICNWDEEKYREIRKEQNHEN